MGTAPTLIGIFLFGLGMGLATDSWASAIVVVGLVMYVNGKTWRG